MRRNGSTSIRLLFLFKGSLFNTFAAMFAPYFVTCEGCDYDNKPIDFPFQSRNVVEFHFPLLLVPFALRNLFTSYIYIYISATC